MAELIDRIAQMRNPLIYGVDIVGGMRSLGLRDTRRTLVGNITLNVGLGAGITVVGAGAVEATQVVDPGFAASVATPGTAELVGAALVVSGLGGLLQGVHQVSKAGQAAREARAGSRSSQRSRWLL